MSYSKTFSKSEQDLVSFLIVDSGFTRTNAHTVIEWLRMDKLTEKEKDVIFKIRLNPKDSSKAWDFSKTLNYLNWRITENVSS